MSYRLSDRFAYRNRAPIEHLDRYVVTLDVPASCRRDPETERRATEG
jgi:hypothetical protein